MRIGSAIDAIQCYGGPSVALGVEMSADTMSLTAWNETRENPKTILMRTIWGIFRNILSYPIMILLTTSRHIEVLAMQKIYKYITKS